MPVLPPYRNQSIANQLTGFYMRATLAFNGLTISKMNNLLHSSVVEISLCTLRGLALVKKYSSNVNNSRAEVSGLSFLRL